MEKQIEEMAKIPESEMGMSGYSKFSWKLWEKGICNMSEAQRADQIMREQGYRKASEVAREIFELIDCAFSPVLVYNGYTIKEYLAELKKKYTEEGK